MPAGSLQSDEASSAPGSSKQKELARCAEPVLLYLTSFRRNAATTTDPPQEVRTRLKGLLDEARRTMQESQQLRRLEETAFYVLVATADQAVLSSEWKGTKTWRMKLLEAEYFGTATGGKRFYEILESTLPRSGEDATAMAELMFVCMALGFQGALIGDSATFERKRLALYEKAQIPGAIGERLSHDAYHRNAKRGVVRLPKVGFARVILVALGVALVLYTMGWAIDEAKAAGIKNEIKELEKTLLTPSDK